MSRPLPLPLELVEWCEETNYFDLKLEAATTVPDLRGAAVIEIVAIADGRLTFNVGSGASSSESTDSSVEAVNTKIRPVHLCRKRIFPSLKFCVAPVRICTCLKASFKRLMMGCFDAKKASNPHQSGSLITLPSQCTHDQRML
jgi:hypothetical protein